MWYNSTWTANTYSDITNSYQALWIYKTLFLSTLTFSFTSFPWTNGTAAMQIRVIIFLNSFLGH